MLYTRLQTYSDAEDEFRVTLATEPESVRDEVAHSCRGDTWNQVLAARDAAERALAECQETLAASLKNAAAVELERDRLRGQRDAARRFEELGLDTARVVLGAASGEDLIGAARRVMSELAECRAQLATVTAERDALREERDIERRRRQAYLSDRDVAALSDSAQILSRLAGIDRPPAGPLPRPEPALHPGSRWDGDAVVTSGSAYIRGGRYGTDGDPVLRVELIDGSAYWTNVADVIAVLHRGGLLP